MSAPSVYEQYMLELINKARMDPNAEAQRLGIGLNDDLSPGTIDGSAKQPLAFMAVLNNSAAKHSISMLADNYFSHTGSDGSSVSDRILAANWAAEPGSGWVMGENISQRASSGNTFGYNSLTIDSHHNGLFKSSGHRTNLMNDRFSEIGIGQEVGSYTASNGFTYQHTSMLTQNFADGGRAYITGVVIDDKDKDKFYDIDEGLGSVIVTAAGATGVFSTSTWQAGGYSLKVDPGTYTVTYSGGGLKQTITKSVTIGSDNVKVDVLNEALSGSDSHDFSNVKAGDVFRFFNTESGKHFFTANTTERDNVLDNLPTFKYEGVVFNISSGDTNIYRFYNTDSQTHFYTISSAEAQQIRATRPEFRDEGIAYQAYDSSNQTNTALYRFYNEDTSSHFFTTSTQERDSIIQNLSNYKYEGIAYYVDIA